MVEGMKSKMHGNGMDKGSIAQPPVDRRSAGLLMLSCLALAGCAVPGAAPPGSFSVGTPMRLGVASLDIINAYEAPSSSPHIDHLLTPTPSENFTKWAETRLVPLEDRGNCLMTITRAAVTEERLPSGGRVRDLVRDEQDRLVKIELEATFSFTHPAGNRYATLSVEASYEHSIPESATPADADRVRMAVMEEGLARFDQEFRKQARALSKNGWPLIGG